MYVTNMLQAVGGYDLKWEDYIRVPQGRLVFICLRSPSCVLVLCSDRCVVIDRLCDVLYVSSMQ